MLSLAVAGTASAAPLRDGDGMIYAVLGGANRVIAFAPRADGDVPPVRVLNVVAPSGAAVDRRGNVYVGDADGIDVFDASGARVRTIGGLRMGMNAPVLAPASPPWLAAAARGGLIALDAQDDVYVSVPPATRLSDGGPGYAVDVFGPGQDGMAAPLRRLVGTGAISMPVGLAHDAAGTLFVATYAGVNAVDDAFPAGTAPSFFTREAPGAIAFDAATSELYVVDVNRAAIDVYRTGAGDRPERTISGAASTLREPYGIAVQPDGDVVVSDPAQNAILVFARGAAGNVAPLRRIAGPRTGLVDVVGVATPTSSAR
jgi:DNA-binding beta-propeller fold protein YncE